MDQPLPDNSELALVPRVRSFANQYVTKAGYAGNETKISNLSVLVFNNDGNLVHIIQGGTGSVTLNKSMLEDRTQSGKLTASTVVMIANISLDSVTKADGTSINNNRGSLTLADMENYTFHLDAGKSVITDISSDTFAGFPMIGGVKGIDLTPTATQQSAVEIGMKILYAKINFSIGVAAGTENQSTGQGSGIQFNLTGYSVHNTSTATTVSVPAIKGKQPVDFLGNTIEDSEASDVDVATASAAYEYPATAGASGGKTGTAILEGDPITFTFYVSENRYNHNSDLKGIYPSNDWLISATDAYDEDVKGYTGMSESDKAKNPLNGVKYFYDDVIQQYKPKLANVSSGSPAAGKATYVLLNGTYTDYRGAVWTVNYKAYLGKDNAHNFHVDRNSEYTNNITIKGIRNNDSHNGEGQVWIDHRVNVTDASNAANHVGITRETLIDSHIEVRPLRVSWPEGEYLGVRVYLPTNSDGSLVDWIGIERFTGENNNESTTYCYHNGKSIGKRKYFTTSLISELQSKGGEFGVRTDKDSGRKYVYLLNGECAWIYFDEYTSTTQREAEIELEFYPESGSPTTTKYIVKQQGLCSIAGYKLESYEEYLHTYDSADKYSLATNPIDYTQQGLAWDTKEGVIYSGTIVVGAANNTTLAGNYRYDFFHAKDQPSENTYYSWDVIDGHFIERTQNFTGETGLVFTNRAAEKNSIRHHDLASLPTTAYQYCLSKNKFTVDEKGDVTMNIHWYLPDVYELQKVLDQTDNTDVDFKSDAHYWSSQPSYKMSLLGELAGFAYEVPENARAVLKSNIKDVSRTTQNRIRCFYSDTAITLDKNDMADRTPDGIGGHYSFVMKAYDGIAPAYFNDMLSRATSTPGNKEITTPYKNESYDYPTFTNPGTEFGYFNDKKDSNGNMVEGFEYEPTNSIYWIQQKDYGGNPTGYYTTLVTFPGLTEFIPEMRGSDASRPSGTYREDVQVESTMNNKHLDVHLTNEVLHPLDYLDGQMLNISFSAKNNSSYSPLYKYSENYGDSHTVKTIKRWKVTYPENSFTPYGLEPKAVKMTGSFEESDRATSEANGKANVEKNGTTKARTEARDKAREQYGGYTSYEIDEDRCDIKITKKSWRLFKYTATVTYTIYVNCSTPPMVYYTNATGGWDEYDSVRTNVDGIQEDALRMYCGNSFTISLSEAYRKDYEITKVKIYYSGDNFVASGRTGAIEEDTYKVYARFVDNEIKLPTSKESYPVLGSAETLQLFGMDYSADAAVGWQQWSGVGRSAITFNLADYKIVTNIGLSGYNKEYQYITASSDLTQYINIDKIEVKCTPKSTATD